MYHNLSFRKLHFIEECLKLSNASTLKKLETILKIERKKELKSKIKPMTYKQLEEKIRQSEEDIANGKSYTQGEVEKYFENKFVK